MTNSVPQLRKFERDGITPARSFTHSAPSGTSPVSPAITPLDGLPARRHRRPAHAAAWPPRERPVARASRSARPALRPSPYRRRRRRRVPVRRRDAILLCPSRTGPRYRQTPGTSQVSLFATHVPAGASPRRDRHQQAARVQRRPLGMLRLPYAPIMPTLDLKLDFAVLPETTLHRAIAHRAHIRAKQPNFCPSVTSAFEALPFARVGTSGAGDSRRLIDSFSDDRFASTSTSVRDVGRPRTRRATRVDSPSSQASRLFLHCLRRERSIRTYMYGRNGNPSTGSSRRWRSVGTQRSDVSLLYATRHSTNKR